MTLRSVPLRVALFGFGLISLAAVATPVHAQYLIDPTGGTSLTSFTDVDDGSLSRSLGGTFSLYGTNVTSLFVQTDGFLSTADGSGFLADRSVAALAGVVGGSVIAPYYDDLYLDTSVGNSIVEKVVAGSYYSVTYTINGYNDTTATATAKFQAVLFTGNTTIKGNAFQAGDFVFSYSTPTNTVSDSNFSVGVARNASTATNAFGVTGGQFATNASFYSNFNYMTQALLFHPNAAGTNYVQSLISINNGAVPEPGSLTFIAIAAIPLAGIALRRRKAV